MGLAPSVDQYAHHNILNAKQLETNTARETNLTSAQRRSKYSCRNNFVPHTSLRPFDIDNGPAKFQLQPMLENEYIIDAQIDKIREELPKYRKRVVLALRDALNVYISQENANAICLQLFHESYNQQTIRRYCTDMLQTDLNNPNHVAKLISALRDRIEVFDEESLFSAFKLSRYRNEVAVPYLTQELYDGLQIQLLYEWLLNDIIYPTKLIEKYGTSSTTKTTTSTRTCSGGVDYDILQSHNIPPITPPTFAYISRIFYSDAPADAQRLAIDCVQLIIEIYRQSNKTRLLTLGKAYCVLRSAGWTLSSAVSLYLKDLHWYAQISPALIQKYHEKFPEDLIVKFVHDCLRRTDFVYDEAVDLYDREIQRRNRAAGTLKSMLLSRGQNTTTSDRSLISLLETCHWDYHIACERFDIRELIKFDRESERAYNARIEQEADEKKKLESSSQTNTTSTVPGTVLEKDKWEYLDEFDQNIITDYYVTFKQKSAKEQSQLFLLEIQRVLSSFLMVQLTKQRMNAQYGVLLDWDTRNIPLTSDHPFFAEKSVDGIASSPASTSSQKDPTADLYALNTLFRPHAPHEFVAVQNIVPYKKDTLEFRAPKKSSSNFSQSSYTGFDDSAFASEASHDAHQPKSHQPQQYTTSDAESTKYQVYQMVIPKKEFNIAQSIPYEANTEITKLFSLTGKKPKSSKLYTTPLSSIVETDVTVLWCKLDRSYSPSHELFRQAGGKWYEQDYFSRFIAKNPKIGDVIITPGYSSCSRFIIHVFVPDLFLTYKQVMDCVNIALLTVKNFSQLITANGAPANPPVIVKTIQFTSFHNTIQDIPLFFSTHILLASIRRFLDIVANRRSIDKFIVTIDDESIYHIALRCACMYFPPPTHDSTTIATLFQNFFNKKKFGQNYAAILHTVYFSANDTGINDSSTTSTSTSKSSQKSQQSKNTGSKSNTSSTTGLLTLPSPSEIRAITKDKTAQTFNTIEHQLYIKSITTYEDETDKKIAQTYNSKLVNAGRYVEYF